MVKQGVRPPGHSDLEHITKLCNIYRSWPLQQFCYGFSDCAQMFDLFQPRRDRDTGQRTFSGVKNEHKGSRPRKHVNIESIYTSHLFDCVVIFLYEGPHILTLSRPRCDLYRGHPDLPKPFFPTPKEGLHRPNRSETENTEKKQVNSSRSPLFRFCCFAEGSTCVWPCRTVIWTQDN